MKRLFVLLMIVLLPLRGWAGDLMGLQMGLQTVVQMAAIGPASPSTSAMPSDCPMASMHAQPGADDAARAPAGTDGCTSCDLCLPLAALAGPPSDLCVFTAHAAPVLGGVAFFSATPTLAFKPPIS